MFGAHPGGGISKDGCSKAGVCFLSCRRRCCSYLAALGRFHRGRTEAGRSTLCLCFCCCCCCCCCCCLRHCCHEGREQDCTLPGGGTALFSLRLHHCILPWGGAQATLEVHPGGGISNNGQGKGRVCCLSCLCFCVCCWCLCCCCCCCSYRCCGHCLRPCCHERQTQDCTLTGGGTALFSLRLPHGILPW